MKETLRWYREWIYGVLSWIGRRAQEFLIGRDHKGMEKRPAMRGIVKKCAYCAEFLKIEARVCVFCGALM